MDIQYVIENIMGLNMKYMIHEDYGFYSYSELYALGDIFVLISPLKEKGVLLELKGKGCRQFEGFLLAQHRSWFDFFMDVLMESGVFKRVDLAINDKTGILDIPELTEKCKNEECVSVFRNFKSYRSGGLVHQEEEPNMGSTLYIGSMKSEVYFCLYQKDYEQYIKNGTPLEDTEVKNRFEIRLKNERAHHAICDLLEHYDAERTAFSIINRYLRFVDKGEGLRRSKWPVNSRWACFMGEGRGKLKLTTKPEPYTFERSLNWLSRQVAPTLKIACKLDKINHTHVVDDMIKHAKLTDRHNKIYKQQAVSVEKIVKKLSEDRKLPVYFK